MVTRRGFLFGVVVATVGAVSGTVVSTALLWEISMANTDSHKGLFLTCGNRCLAIYWQKDAGYAITNWTDIQKQQLPSAVAWWQGRLLIQRSVWRGDKGIRDSGRGYAY